MTARWLVSLAAAAAATAAATGPAAASPYDEHNCGDRLVLCLQLSGAPFAPDWPRELSPGERVHVIVLGDTDAEISIDVHSSRRQNRLLAPPAAPAPPAVGVAAVAGPPRKLAERVIDVPDADALTIYIVEKVGDESTTGSLTVRIRDTLYFARAGLAFAWIDRGERTITAERTIVEGSDFFPGVALTFWPWGHRNRALAGLERGGWRALGDMVGVQLGTDLDFSTPFQRSFLGVTVEPIAGLGLSAGYAMTKGQFFSGAPAGSDMTVVDKHMLRPYVSLTLTSELVDTLRSLAGKKEQPAPAP